MVEAIAPTAPLRAALDALAETLERIEFCLPSPARESRRQERGDLVWSIREYLLRRLADLEGPVVAVVIGSTGSGKSTLLNSLAQADVSPVGAIRPTTRMPVVWTHREHAERYGDDFLTGYGVGPDAPRPLRVVAGERPLLEHLTVLDAPDFDSVVAENRQMADELLAVADLCVFVTTAQRYADAVPWEFLRRAHGRGLPLLFVVNRLPPGEEARRQVLEDYARRLARGGLLLEPDPSLLFAVAEQPTHPVHGGLPAEAVEGVAGELALLSDPALRRQLIRQATEGAVAEVVYRTRRTAEMVAEERSEGEALKAAAREAYSAQQAEVARLLREGGFIRGEVLARWEEFVGTGELVAALAGGLARLGRWVRTVAGTGGEEARRAGRETAAELVAAVVRRADLAARAAAAAWERDQAGKGLLEDAAADLWRHDPDTPRRARRALESWTGELARLVAEEGHGKRRTAKTASWAVNAVAVAALLGVFAHTGGMTGTELGVAAGAAAAQQKLLERVFGSAAARSLAEEGRRRLEEALGEVLEEDGARFSRLVDEHLPAQGMSQLLGEQLEEVSRRAGELYRG